ncbi:helix-turn-helix domain-containing protein [Luteimonas sp. SMYT11W]|uniref:Helix-turn-helix domain-containing protein n=1 Tax=Luteimonas flava TaxID=3115822 RepID=A0ABU7WCT3_9GAMM
MRVTKAQASANRARVVETASALFRERGYDGVGVADLMAAAGFTHGGFYKQFQSKADLMAEAAACGFEQAAQRAAAQTPADFVAYYLSREHRDHRGAGCTMAALGADAARQSDAVRATFAEGIEGLLADIQNAKGETASPDGRHVSRAETLEMMARLVGALVLSRACPDDSPLADEILEACRGKRSGMQREGNSEAF